MSSFSTVRARSSGSSHLPTRGVAGRGVFDETSLLTKIVVVAVGLLACGGGGTNVGPSLGGSSQPATVTEVQIDVDIGGFSLAFSDGAGATSTSGNLHGGTTLPSGCFYLFTGAGINGYSDGQLAIGDFLYDSALDDDGGVALVSATGDIVYQVGLSTGSLYVEGNPLANPNGGNHERSGPDTNDNARDFRQPGGVPEGSHSACRR